MLNCIVFVQNSGLQLIEIYGADGLPHDQNGLFMNILLCLARDAELRSNVVSNAVIVKMVIDLLEVGPSNQQVEVGIRLR